MLLSVIHLISSSSSSSGVLLCLLWYYSLYLWGNWGSGSLGDLARFTQLRRSRNKFTLGSRSRACHIHCGCLLLSTHCVRGPWVCRWPGSCSHPCGSREETQQTSCCFSHLSEEFWRIISPYTFKNSHIKFLFITLECISRLTVCHILSIYFCHSLRMANSAHAILETACRSS